MNAITKEQRRDVIEGLASAWEAACEECSYLSLGYLLRCLCELTDTEIVDRLHECYLGDGHKWSFFTEAALHNEYIAKFRRKEGGRPLHEVLAEMYNFNPADKEHVRALIAKEFLKLERIKEEKT